MDSQMSWLLMDILFVLVIIYLSFYYKKNLLRKIIKYSIISYLIIGILLSIVLLPVALIFNDSGAETSSIIFGMLPSAYLYISTIFIPIALLITFILVGKKFVKQMQQGTLYTETAEKLSRTFFDKLILLMLFVGIGGILFVLYSGEGQFTRTGKMNIPRAGHSATLLNDGKVLITGGHSHNRVIDSAEIYNPETGKFSIIGRMNCPRTKHSTVLLNNNKVLILGGEPSTPNAEIYDPNTNKFSIIGQISYPKSYNTVTLLKDGRVLILYEIGNYKTKLVAEEYNPKTNKFNLIGKSRLYNFHHQATLLPDGRVLITALGQQNAELYNPKTNKFSLAGKPTNQLGLFTATLLNKNQVLLAGNNNIINIYDIKKGNFKSTSDKIKWDYCSSNNCHAILLKNNKVLLIPVNSYHFDPIMNLILGNGGNKQKLYDPIKDKLLDTKRVNLNITETTATLLKNGYVLISGGNNVIAFLTEGEETNTALLYKY